MKSVLISIQPKWVKKIANGQKTIEVRKTAPKCEVPFKCYIYCTSAKPYLYKEANPPFELFLDSELYKGKGYDDRLFSSKVVGEFACDEIIKWQYNKSHQYYVDYPDDCTSYFPYLKCHSEATGLKCSELENYGKGKTLYGLHISDLKIYDKPKELSEFRKPCKINLPMCDRCEYYSTWNGRCENITRAPQSWCYVEKL